MNAEPTRTCVGCHSTGSRKSLLRIVERDGHAVFDAAGVLPGRGTWVHPRESCLEKGITPRQMSRSFRRKVRFTDAAAADAWAHVVQKNSRRDE